MGGGFFDNKFEFTKVFTKKCKILRNRASHKQLIDQLKKFTKQ